MAEMTRTEDTLCDRAEALLAEGRGEEAALELARALRDFPGRPRICSRFCEVYMDLSMRGADHAWIRDAVEGERNLTRIFLHLVACLFEEGLFKAADSVLEALVWGDPCNAEAWNDLGAVRFSMNELDSAEKAFTQAQALAPGDADTLVNLTLLYLARRDKAAAVRTARIALDPSLPPNPQLQRELAALVGKADPATATRLMEAAMNRHVPS